MVLMIRLTVFVAIATSLTIPMSTAASYTARQTTIDGVAVVQLSDPARHTDVSIAVGVGNIAYELKVNGKNALYFPFQSLADFKAKPQLCGVPFLAPWANRLDQEAFYANGNKYILNKDLGNLRLDGNHLPIHGLISFTSLWQVVEAKADGSSAHVTSRLEFWKHPELMAQFPFAHTIEMTYTLSNGVLQVTTAIHNLSADAMPVSIGFHPYFQVHDAPRDSWTVHLSGSEHVVLSKQLIPTGETKPMEFGDTFTLAGKQLDDVFTGLPENAEFWVKGKDEKISVHYGPHFKVAVAYAPPRGNFICFEPMAALTNGMNLAHDGKYKDLQSVAPGGEWKESFRIQPTGF
jgi:aldose 1-epimerase